MNILLEINQLREWGSRPYWAGMCAVLSVLAVPTVAVSTCNVESTKVESVTVCSLEADPHAVISAISVSVSAVFFILVFVFLND
jgi:hypothetical protein